MKLAICGDSWFSQDPSFPGCSFGEILAAKHGWQLLPLARPGMSNFGIALQVDRAMQSHSDVIVVGSTFVARIEIPLPDRFLDRHSRSNPQLATELDSDCVFYHRSYGIDNIDHSYYPYHPLAKAQNTASLSSNVIANFLIDGAGTTTTSPDIKQALKYYVSYLFDPGHKRQTDTWLLSDLCRRLIAYGKPWLLFTQCLLNDYFSTPPFPEYAQDLAWIDQKHLVHAEQFAYHRDMEITNQAVFHYCHTTSGSVMADFVDRRLQEQL